MYAFPQQLLPVTEDALEKLSLSIYRTSVYQDTMNDVKLGPDPMGEGWKDKFNIHNKENTGSFNLEIWEVNDQEKIEEKCENEEEQIEVS